MIVVDQTSAYSSCACASCGTVAAECIVPAEAVGREGAPIPTCWTCAHMITEHDAAIGSTRGASSCGCTGEDIIPRSLVGERS